MIGSSQGIRVFTRDKEDIAPDAAIQIILGHVRYIPHDVIRYFTGFIRFLIRQGKLNDDDPEIMAAQLCFPVFI